MTRRYARRVDATQEAIVAAVRKVGWLVWIIEEPCDLLCYKPALQRWRTLECKTPRNKRGEPLLDKRQREQREFCEVTHTPYVTTAEQAIAALESSVTSAPHTDELHFGAAPPF